MAGIYKRGRIWWGRFKARGVERRRSLKTADRCVAEVRLLEWRQAVMAEQLGALANHPPPINHSVLGSVYAIGYGDKVKIGWTQGDAVYRLKSCSRITQRR